MKISDQPQGSSPVILLSCITNDSVDWIQLYKDKVHGLMTGYFEQGSESYGSIKGGIFLGQLIDY